MPIFLQKNGKGTPFAQKTGYQRARRVVSPSSGIVRGKFPSRKNGRMVHHEGLLELAAYYWLEADPSVISYREQPCTLQYPDGSRLRRYTPDLEVFLSNGEAVLVEIKPAAIAKKAEIAHKHQCIRQHLTRLGRQFFIITDEVIRQEPYLSNLRWLYSRANHIKTDLVRQDVLLRQLNEKLPISLASFDAGTPGQNSTLIGLILDGVLSCRLDVPLDLNSMVYFSTPNNHLLSEEFPWHCTTCEEKPHG